MTGRRQRPLVDRFNEKWMPEPNSGCWLWIGSATLAGPKRKDSRGHLFGGKGYNGHLRANRASWIIYRGEIPPGLEVCHSCDVSLCVNPDHLFLGTHLENMEDCAAKGRRKFTGRGGTSHHFFTLTEDDVREIRKSSDSKESLAKRFGVSPSRIYSVQARRSWKHVVD